MSLQRLNEIVTKAAKALYDNEKFAIGVLAVKARRLAESYPLDQTVVGMSAYLNKKASSTSQAFLTRAELKDAYNRLYTRNSKFAELFTEELGLNSEEKSPKGFQRDPNEGRNLVEGAYEKLADPILSNALASAFDSSIPYKPYSNQVAKSAQHNCLHELNRLGVSPKKIDVVAGQTDLLICQAAYETPRGTSNVLIPVEVKAGQALLPTVFLSTAGFLDLSAETVTEHLHATAGKAYKVDVQKLLEMVATAKNGTPETLSEVERIVMKANAAKETPVTHTVNGILYQQIDKVASEVQEVEYEQPAEVQEISKRLTSAAGVAEFTLGKTNVDLGRKMVRQAMFEFGYKNAQVGVADSNKDTIFYAVSVDHSLGFRVSVKVANKKIQYPSFIFAGERMVEFSKGGISDLLAGGETDHNATVVSSPMFGFSPADLVKQVRASLQNRDYRRTEEALAVLQASGDQKAYRVGYELYTAALKQGDLQKQASATTCCSRQYKSAHSKYMICAHTNLPVHKVYQDKNGDCRPMYRQGMSDSAEGGSFLHSKIFLG
jgi:hypothetical protein